ncbi:MAG: lipoate--protein ligase, partial [Bacteroides sp. SM23_62_1]
MLCIRHDITDPYFNLATEEYFLKKFSQEFLMLYINDPSVIIGKHQNVYAEINLDFVSKNHIKVVRRISGGGTVWHDHGNLNFSFIRNGKEGELVNFYDYSVPILGVLKRLG